MTGSSKDASGGRGREGMIRIQRALARAGIGSRRRADELVAAGRVRINGAVAAIGQTVDPAVDRISVDGADVPSPVAVQWLVLHKPPGVLTTARDEKAAGRQTVFDLVPPALRRPGLTYVGRLDYMTEGILLLTTDGIAANRLTHPSNRVERTYVATVQGNAVAAARALRAGVQLEDGPVRMAAVEARHAGPRRWEIELTLTEGRTREVRRACEAVGLTVERLVRTRFGPIVLGTLPPGGVRPLTAAEVRRLEAERWPTER
jgi:23S rRNA pseudouridine2605 synthase